MNNSDKFISQSNTNCEADGTSNHVINNSVCGNSSIKSITSSPLRSSVREPIDHHNTSNGVSFSYLNYPNTNQCRNSRTISKYFRQNQLVNSIKKSFNNSCNSCYLSHNFCATDNKSSYRSMKCDMSSSSRNYAAYSEKLEFNNRFFDNNKNTTTNNNQNSSNINSQKVASSKSNNYSTVANYSNCITNSASNLFIDDIHNISPGATDVAAAAVAATSAVSTDTNSTNFTRMNNSVEQNFLNYFRHHSSRASPVTVQWLLENYESADGVSLLRSGLYSHYLTHCLQNWLEPMNPASFGKLIRSIFVGLRTRRLGTRGNSKYYYYGIRIKATSAISQTAEVKSMRTCNKRDNSSCTSRNLSNVTCNVASSRNDIYKTINHQYSHSEQQRRKQDKYSQTSLFGIQSSSYRTSAKFERSIHTSLSSSSVSSYLSSPSSLGVAIPTCNSNNQIMMNSLYNRISNEFRTSLTYSMTPTSITNYNNNDNLLRKLWLSNCISSIRHNNNNSGSYLINYNKKKPTNYRTKTSLDPLNNFSYGGSMKNLFNSNIHTDFETDLNLNVKWDFQINANYDNIKSQWNKSIRSSETETVHEQKSHFGNNPNLKFTFSNLIELCDLAGLHISEYDISSCIIKSEFHEHYTESNTFKSSIQQKAYFVKLYEIHCEQVYTAVINIQIENLQTIWHRFWCSSESTTCTSECSLPKSYLIELCDDSKICQFIELADRTLYQILLDIIINDSLKTLCNDLLQALQTMIKLMEAYLQSAIRHFNPQLINRKLSAVACFIKGLHRAMSISCFSHTVGNIINDTQKCEQILSDIDKLDLKCIEAQGSWASDCLLYGLIQNSFCSSLIVHNSGKSSSKKGIKEEPSDQLSSLSTLKSSGYTENFISLTREMFSSEKYLYNDDDNSYYGADIKVLHSEMCNLLMNKSSLTMWTRWLDNIVTRSLVNSPSGPKRASAARQLMLVWTYYSSLLMRELTLRSAISFSNCHLLRMLCDEYLSYRLEQVASSPLTTLPKLFNETPSTPLYPNKNDSNTNIDCFQITTEHLEGYENLPTSTVNNIISLKSYPSNNEISNQHENICNKHLSGKNLTSYSTATTTHNEISSRNSITEDNDDGDIFMENSNTTLLLSSINSDNYLEYIDTQILSNHDDIELVDEDDVDNDALCNALSPNCLLQRNTTNTDNLLFNMNGSDDITSVNTSVDSHDDHSHLQRGVVDEHTPSHMVVTSSKDSSDSDRPNNYFSFGFSNDPILTETTQFNDPDDDYAKSTLLNDGIIDIDHSKYWSCRQHPSTHHYSPKKSLETLNRSSFCSLNNSDTEKRRFPLNDVTNIALSVSKTPVRADTKNFCISDTVALPSTLSYSSSSSRPNRKLSKPNILHIQTHMKTYDEDQQSTSYRQNDTYCFSNRNSGSFSKCESSDWLESSVKVENNDNINNPKNNKSNYYYNQSINSGNIVGKANKSFLKLSSSSHVEQRIVASLPDDLIRTTNSQAPRKTVCITVGSEENEN